MAGSLDSGKGIARAFRNIGTRFIPIGARSTPKGQVDDPCHWRCGDCGYLIPQTLDDAYRPRGNEVVGPCPACGGRHWADLRSGGVVEALDDRLDTLHKTRNHRRRGIRTLIATLFGVLAAVGSGVGRNDGSVIVFPLLALVLVVIVRSAVQDIKAGRRPALPVRWSLAALPAGDTVGTETGSVAPSDQLLRAPVSGRPCVAYELGVRSDTATDDDPWTCALLEQRVGPFAVGDVSVAAERVFLDVPRERWSGDLTDPSIARLLRNRGIDPDRPGHVLYETIVEVGDTVVLEQTSDGGIVMRRA